MLNHRQALGSAAAADFGGVSALDFNVAVNRLLVGYARGQILMWDPIQGKLLRTINDAHPAGIREDLDSGKGVGDFVFTRQMYERLR